MREAHPIICLPFQCPLILHSRAETFIPMTWLPFPILHSGPTLIPEVALPSDTLTHSYACFLYTSLFGTKIFKYLIAHEIVAFSGRKMTDKMTKNIVAIKNLNIYHTEK